jgi:predicted ester cyclase
MSIEEENKEAIYRLNEAVNKGDFSFFPDLFAQNSIYHVNPEVIGFEGVQALHTMMRVAFPDYHEKIEYMFAEGDMVAQFYLLTGTFKGELTGLAPSVIAPTGKQLSWPVVVLSRFENGKQVEAWNYSDSLTMAQQLGIRPPF